MKKIIWKTVQIGNFLSKNNLCDALDLAKIKIADPFLLYSKQLMLSNKGEELRLVLLKVSEIGFSNGASFREICNKAIHSGLKLCPPEVAPQLLIQESKNLPDFELNVASVKMYSEEASFPNDPFSFIFSVKKDFLSFSRIYGEIGEQKDFWNENTFFIFCL
jgi:hypothetical protein